MTATVPLAEELKRLRAEKEEADRRYNEALTALDAALQRMPALPQPPPAYDEAQIAPLNQAWEIVPGNGPGGRGWRGRIAGLVWRVVAPMLQRQQAFNAALVDHLNRNLVPQREAQKAIESTIAVLRDQLGALVAFQSHLIVYLQQITPYVDTKDRAVGGRIQVVNAGLSGVAGELQKRYESLTARELRFEAAAGTRLEALATAQADVRSGLAVAQQATLAIKRELERLMARGAAAASTGAETAAAGAAGAPSRAVPAAPGAGALDSYKYVGFEDQFRGSQEEIRARLADYVPCFAGAGDVLDLGCGRGEFLDLLREHGIGARGVDLNHEMVEVCRARGLEVAEGDALAYLASLPDSSLGGLFAAQVVEHLPPGYLMRLLETAAHKLRPGARIVLETINPACWLAFFESYIRDITHVQPLHPDTLRYLLLASGFSAVEVEYRVPVAEQDRLQPLAVPLQIGAALADLVETHNANVEKLNRRLFTFMDYAAIGTK